MADFIADLRDIKFVLFEQLDFASLLAAKRFEDFDKQDIDMVLDEAHKFARDVVGPANELGDRQGCVLADGKVTVPEAYQKAYKLVCESGWMGINADPEWGGGGMPHVVNTAVCDMMVGANPALCLSIILTPGAARLIEAFGTDELKQKYLPKMFTGEWGGTMCLTEAQAGSDVGAATTKAIPQGDHYLISGDKIFITYGEQDLTPNIIHLVLARIEGAPKGSKGLSLFAVPKYIPKADGSCGEFNDVVCTSIEHKMGINGSPTCQMSFGVEEKCKGWLVGEEGAGMAEMFKLMNEARINIALQGSSVASAAFQAAWAYARERAQGPDPKAFKDPDAPRAPIVRHPDVAMMLARQKAYADGLRTLVFFNSYCEDMAHVSEGDEAARWQGLSEILTPISKSYASDMGFRVCEWAVQTYGGYGFLKDYPVEQYLRDTKIASIYEGTNGIQAMDLVGRKLGMKNGFNVKALDGLFGALLEAQSEHAYLKGAMASFAAARKELGKVTRFLGEAGAKRDMQTMLLGATNYLFAAGDVCVSYFLLDGAVKAYDRLLPLLADAGVEIADVAAVQKLGADNAEVRHLYGRIKSAQFFAAHELPNMYARSASVQSGDTSAMELIWEPTD